MQLWRPEFELDGINSGSWFHCLPIRPVRKENEVALQQAEMKMIRWTDVGVKFQVKS